jgi:hypothetical protein
MPTARAPTGRRRKIPPSVATPCPSDRPARAIETSIAAARWRNALERRCLIDQHDGNSVAHGIAQSADVAVESLREFAILQLSLAPWADEDGKQLRREAQVLESLMLE